MIRYEWVVEEVDEFGDITSVEHWDTLAEAREFGARTWTSCDIGLVRDKLDAFGDVESRTWAYLDPAGRLPETFENGVKVPKRFREEAR